MEECSSQSLKGLLNSTETLSKELSKIMKATINSLLVCSVGLLYLPFRKRDTSSMNPTWSQLVSLRMKKALSNSVKIMVSVLETYKEWSYLKNSVNFWGLLSTTLLEEPRLLQEGLIRFKVFWKWESKLIK